MDSNCNMNNGVDTMHIVKGFGYMIFHLESRVSLKVVGVMNVPGMSVSFLLVLALEDEGMRRSSKMEQCSYV